jgi:uncharacterized protein YicC (UPF0701 family)
MAAKSQMTDNHKAALAVGREEGRAVRTYLEALDSNRPKRGRKRTKESISARLERIADEFSTVDPLKRLQLAQEQLDLTEELESMDDGQDIAALETEFTRLARAYANRKGISYAAFRSIGVPAATLKKAGIPRTQ